MTDELNPFELPFSGIRRLAAVRSKQLRKQHRARDLEVGLKLGREAAGDEGLRRLQAHLRSVDDETLGDLWREWKTHAHRDLRLEAEQELERRKRHRQFR